MASQGLLKVGPGHVGQSCLQRLALVACFSEKLETILAGTKPRTLHHRSPGGQALKEEALDDLP